MRDSVTGAGFPGGWYVAFFDGERPRWWWRLCRPGFRHAAAFGYCADQAVWLVYEVTLSRTYVRALDSAAMDDWVDALPAHRTIVLFDRPDDMVPRRLGFWCTTCVAHLVGARSRALRPQALYRDLVAQGARAAFQGGER